MPNVPPWRKRITACVTHGLPRQPPYTCITAHSRHVLRNRPHRRARQAHVIAHATHHDIRRAATPKPATRYNSPQTHPVIHRSRNRTRARPYSTEHALDGTTRIADIETRQHTRVSSTRTRHRDGPVPNAKPQPHVPKLPEPQRLIRRSAPQRVQRSTPLTPLGGEPAPVEVEVPHALAFYTGQRRGASRGRGPFCAVLVDPTSANGGVVVSVGVGGGHLFTEFRNSRKVLPFRCELYRCPSQDVAESCAHIGTLLSHVWSLKMRFGT